MEGTVRVNSIWGGSVAYFLDEGLDASFATIKRGGIGRSH